MITVLGMERSFDEEFDEGFDWDAAAAEIEASLKSRKSRTNTPSRKSPALRAEDPQQRFRRCQHICLGLSRHGSPCPPPHEVRSAIYESSPFAATPFDDTARSRVTVMDGGATSVGFALHEQSGGDARLGIMVAANSGRAAGACGLDGAVQKIHPHHSTQEEDIVSCWMTASAGPRKEDRNALFRSTIDRAWGMEEIDSRSLRTLQGVDYVHARGAEAFADAWIVHGATLCAKSQKPPSFNLECKFPATLVFSSGPNAGCRQSPHGSTARTLNERAAKDYAFFRECVKETVRTGLDAMVSAGCNVALVAKVSCGIYAGRHRDHIMREFQVIVDELLAEQVTASQIRAAFFLRVVIPELVP